MKTACKTNFINLPQTLNISFVTPACPLLSVIYYAIQVNYSGGGTPNGTFSLEISCDPVALPVGQGDNYMSANQPVNWSTLISSPLVVTTNSTYCWDITSGFGYNWVRLRYVDSSNGSSTAILSQYTVNTKAV